MVVPHGIEPLRESCIVGSCNGLVCLIRPSNFVIYNPTTREYIELPGSHFVDEAALFRARYETFYGFGYDSQSDDYKIAVVVGDVVGVENCKVAIFSLKSSCWRMIEVPFQEEEVECSRPVVYWKGALHWLFYARNKKGKPKIKAKPKIMSFDLSEERFHQVLPVPQIGDTRLLGLGIHGANLFIYNTAHPRIEAWIRDEYRIGAPWNRWFSVEVNWNIFLEKIPLVYTRSGKIVFLMDRSRMILFNPEDNTCRDHPLGSDFIRGYAVYLETLVSPSLGGAVE